jgi:putative flavoprotein involved in K+ transport
VSGCGRGSSRASGRTVSFSDGSELDVDAVVWATGYRPDHSWIELPLVDAAGNVLHRRGVTEVAGIYFLGLSWQHTRGSALLGWVKDDAEFIAGRIAGRAESETVPETNATVSEVAPAPRAAGLAEGV